MPHHIADAIDIADANSTDTAIATTAPRRNLCRHIHTHGQRCGSPALRGQDYCYYHDRCHRQVPSCGRTKHFAMPRIDDRAAIQIALYEVLSRLSCGDIEYKMGSTLLYGLQIASTNLPRAAAEEALEAQPQVDEFDTDYHTQADLAPIAEYPTPTTPNATTDCHSERSEESPHSASDTAAIPNACHSERSERDPRPACSVGLEESPHSAPHITTAWHPAPEPAPWDESPLPLHSKDWHGLPIAAEAPAVPF